MDVPVLLLESFIGVGMAGIIYGLFTIHSKIKDLWEWHNKEDEEGVKVWYTRNKNMEDVLEKMSDVIEHMDRREERALIIQNETIRGLQEHTNAITKLVAVVEALTAITLRRNGK